MTSQMTWKITPTAGIGRPLAMRVARVPIAVSGLALVHAARGEGYMKAIAGWNDVTGYARASLYGRAEETTIYLGTTNDEYGLFLEMGTVHMAARPAIAPAVPVVAEAYFRDVVVLVRGILGG